MFSDMFFFQYLNSDIHLRQLGAMGTYVDFAMQTLTLMLLL